MLNLMMDAARKFLLVPISLHVFSALVHLGFLLFVIITWLCKKLRINGHGSTKQSPLPNDGALFYKQTLFSCVVLVLLNVAMCFLNLFYWHKNGWTIETIVTFSDALLGTLVWLVVSIYLHNHVSGSPESNYPFALRICWIPFFPISCFCLVVDYVYYKHNRYLAAQFLVSDTSSTFSGLLLCYMGFFGKREGEVVDHFHQESLLNNSSSIADSLRESKTGGETITPYATSGIFSLLTFSWIRPLIAIGYKKPLDLEDVPHLDRVDGVKGAFSILRNKLESDASKNNQITTFSLAKALVLTTWKDIIITALLALVYTLASYVGPFLIDTFVQYLNGHRGFKNEGFLLVSAFVVAKMVECLAQRHWDFKLQQAGIRARAALVAMIYVKGLTLSSQSKQGHSHGEVINFMAVDAERIGDFSSYMHYPWLAIVQVGLALVILHTKLGLASLSAFLATIIVMLANVPLGSFQEKFQEKLMKYKDKRMKITSEILRNMRILKLQGWEMKFLSKIDDIRSDESRWLKKYMLTMAMTTFAFWVAPTFVAVVTFGTCLFAGIPLDSGKVLSSLATFKILQESVYNLPDTISMIAQTKVSMDRITSFLRLDELDSDLVEMLPRGSSPMAIEIINGIFAWDASSLNPTLKDINIKVNHATRVAVCGTVGSGKSSLLSCILGEVAKISGIVKLEGTTAYVAQSPWIQSGKIEENILFGKDMDRERYEKVLEACALKEDLEMLLFGDQTVIGERGINLSGGQKQRIQIARALYQDADIYLLDDPFSAVDAHTGSHLFKVLNNGRIAQAGTYDSILNPGGDYIQLVGAHKDALLAIDSIGKNSKSVLMGVIEKKNDKGLDPFKNDKQEVSINGQAVHEVSINGQAVHSEGKKRQLVEEEEREKGKIGLFVYWKYITAVYGGVLVPLILLAQIMFELLQISSNYWMCWASSSSKSMAPRVGGSMLIIVYVALGIGCSFCILARAMLLMTAAYKTANRLFYKMHFCIFRAHVFL